MSNIAPRVVATVNPLLANGIRFKPTDRIYGTIFASKKAKEQRRLEWTDLDQLAREIINAEPRASKYELQWIKLARFGDTPSDKGCLRHDLNVEWISGIEIDIDGKGAGMEDATQNMPGVQALLYSTPSSTPEKPHYRVLCPLSGIYYGPPDALRDLRAKLVARVNGLLGGIVAGESFALSQSYYFGNVEGRPPIKTIINKRSILHLSNLTIDLLHGCDVLYKNGSPVPPKRRDPMPAPEGLIENDDCPTLLAEAWGRCQAHIAKFGIGSQPRGHRALGLGAWLADMRTSAGEILSLHRIVEIMQEAGYGEIDEALFETRKNPRGCLLVLSAAEKAIKNGWIQ
jgi:hypothetical protein